MNKKKILLVGGAGFIGFNFIKLYSKIHDIYVIDNYDHLRHLKLIYSNSNHGFFFRDGIWLFLPNKKLLMNKQDLKKFVEIEVADIAINKKYKIKQNSKSGILGLGWSHPSYGRRISNIGAWSEGYVSSLIFSLTND